MRSQDEQNPMHTRTAYIPIYTPPDVRIGLTLLPARYIGRGLFGTITDALVPNWLRKSTTDFVTKPLTRDIVKDVEGVFANPKYSSITSRLRGMPKDRMIDTLRSGKGNTLEKQFYNEVRGHLGKWGAAGRTDNLIEYAFSKGGKGGPGTVTKESIKDLRGAVNRLNFHYGYDLTLGAGSAYMSHKLNQRAIADMKHIYTEVVSYETGKPADQIGIKDIFNSDNRIIQSTKRNFERKRAQRYGTDALFFLRLPFRWISASDLAIGAKGIMWFNDVWGRKPTMLESFIYFVNDKLNPEYGISDPISKGDIINFFQQYAIKFEPHKAFHTLIASDPTDARVWAQSEPIFARMTELMNLTYNYKHVTELDDKTGHPVASADFTLPKFIYLLGHGLIDPHDPVKTLAIVEIANLHGMDAVKEVEADFKKGVPLRELLDRYPVSLDALRRDISSREPEEAESSSLIRPGALAQRVPDNIVREATEASTLRQADLNLSTV